MISPRWRKVARDLWQSKARTLLVVTAIALGVVAVGMIGQAETVLLRGMADAYAQAHPASATLSIGGFDQDLVAKIRQVPGVVAAEGRTLIDAHIDASSDEAPQAFPEHWKGLSLYALNAADVRMNKLVPTAGVWPPPNDQVVLERTALEYLHAQVGDQVGVETPDGKIHRLRIAGTVRDPVRITASMSGISYGYVAMDTLTTLGLPRAFNELTFTVAANAQSKRHVQAVAGLVREQVSKTGGTVFATDVPEPGKHWAADIVTSQGAILGTLGLFALLLGACLVVNTIFALLAGQIRQIGVMKVLGADSASLMRIYLGMVLAFCALALAVGIPLGQVGASAITSHSNALLGFDSSGYGLSSGVLALEVVVGLVVPLLAALYPVIHGSCITVRDAIGGQGAGTQFGHAATDRLLEQVRGLSRPLVLSLRNTFRRKGRLALTVFTLSVGGALVIAVFTVRASMSLTLDNSLKYTNYDISLNLPAPQPVSRLQQEAMAVPGVTEVEGWGRRGATLVHPDGTQGSDIVLFAPPEGSSLIQPTIVQGRWLRADDDHGLVLETSVLVDEPDIRVGDNITLKIDGKESTWQVVGFARKLAGYPLVYVNASALARVLGEEGQASMLQVVTKQHDAASQARIAAALADRFKGLGLPVAASQITSDVRQVQESRFGVVLSFLVVLAMMLSVVAGLGLMGTMGLNVLERTREIGIMRTIGATDGAIWSIVVAEGILIGLVSWVAASLLAWPISRYLCAVVGHSIFHGPLDYALPLTGPLLWLGAVLVLSTLASLVPAYNASRLTVRDVLAHE